MLITREAAIDELHKAIPSFKSEWSADQLPYLVFADFARFICSEGEVLEYLKPEDEVRRFSKVPACMQILERLIREGDRDVRDLVFETIEALSSCPHNKEIRKWAPPEVLSIWHS